jgi:hypothetical protein
VRAIQHAGEHRASEVIARAIAPFRLSSGSYRMQNTFVYLIATA